jgi:glycosyltransferase involved in cell wall biosynthesis
MAGPSLAAVISNYNYGQYVGQALDSVLNQTQPFDEVIVVDDGSTDDSPSVLARYADVPRVRVLRIPNGGQFRAERTGIAASQSDYIYTLDADDFAAANLVESVRPLLGREPAKVMFQLHAVNEDGSPLNSVFPIFPTNYNSSTMIEDNERLGYYVSPPTSANVYSRWALERLGYEALNSRAAFDGMPNLCMPYMGEIAVLSQPLAYYRIHGGSMSTWANPTTELLNKEIDIFLRTWAEAASALGFEALPFAASQPLYVRERHLMIASNENRLFILPQVWGYVSKLLTTNLTAMEKLVFTAWAVSLLVPVSVLRSRAIRMRRSSVNRSQRLNALLNFLLRSLALQLHFS